jgi:hypothetical protein
MKALGGFLLVMVLAASSAFTSANAHESSESYALIEVNGNDVSVTLSASARDIAQLPSGQSFADYASSAVRLKGHEKSCELKARRILGLSGKNLDRVQLSFTCADTNGLEIQIFLFRDIIAGHVTLATLMMPDAEPLQSAFGGAVDTWSIPAQGQVTPSRIDLMRYARLGFVHIFLGPDHMLFLFGLVACFGLTRGLIWAITGFTLGHSIALGLVALHLVQPASYVTESLIGLTIMLVGLDGLVETGTSIPVAAALVTAPVLGLFIASLLGIGHFMPVALAGLSLAIGCYAGLLGQSAMRAWWRPLATIPFGLIHGSGFAGGLIEAGLPAHDLFGPIIAFNLGVEAGQLVLAAASGVLLTWVSRRFGRPHTIIMSIFPASVFGCAQFLLRALQ